VPTLRTAVQAVVDPRDLQRAALAGEGLPWRQTVVPLTGLLLVVTYVWKYGPTVDPGDGAKRHDGPERGGAGALGPGGCARSGRHPAAGPRRGPPARAGADPAPAHPGALVRAVAGAPLVAAAAMAGPLRPVE
jgi:hypothetical protein